MTGAELAARIKRVYDAHPEGLAAHHTHMGPEPQGIEWFADRVHRTPRTINRWINDRSAPEPLALDRLEDLEREAGIDPQKNLVDTP